MRGILGGTFDPPHLGHLAAAETAHRQLGLTEVTFLPAGSPWQKAGLSVAPPSARWEMTCLAIAGIDYFNADDREIRRDGPTYTADTLGTFGSDEELLLVLGADAALGIPTWDRFEEVLDRAAIAVAPRPGVDSAEVTAAVDSDVLWLDMPAIDVSGTALRERVRSGRSIRFLVPDSVWKYVAENDLYRQASD
jgi:nicotinate-nucleotide adenylyltransferase